MPFSHPVTEIHPMTLSTIMERVAQAVAVTVTLSGGGAILSGMITNERQEVQLEALSQISPKLDSMDEKLNDLRQGQARTESNLQNLKERFDESR